MKARNIGYWATTALAALAFAGGAVTDLSRAPDMVAAMTRLGYPPYFMAVLGGWKLLAVPAVLAPGFPRLKEWAYAGMFFDLTGAIASHAMSGGGAAQNAPPLAILALVLASWALRPETRKLQDRAARSGATSSMSSAPAEST